MFGAVRFSMARNNIYSIEEKFIKYNILNKLLISEIDKWKDLK